MSSGRSRSGAPQSGRGRIDPGPPDATGPDLAQRARQICLRELATRPRTRAELADALRRGGIPDDVITELLDRYHDVGMIDDAAFARAWVTSRHHGRGLGRRALAGELRRKGIDADTIGVAIEEVDDDTEARTARALVDRKLRGAPPAPPEVMLRRLVAMLARKGYPPGVAIRTVREAIADRDGEQESVDLDTDAWADHLGSTMPD